MRKLSLLRLAMLPLTAAIYGGLVATAMSDPPLATRPAASGPSSQPAAQTIYFRGGVMTWTSERPGGTLQLEDRDGTAVLTPHGGERITGIGGGTLGLREGKWPGKVVIRLELGSLEGFGIGNGALRLQTRLGGPGDVAAIEGNDEVKYHMPVERQGNAIEVTLPPEALPNVGEQANISWIDAFRN